MDCLLSSLDAARSLSANWDLPLNINKRAHLHVGASSSPLLLDTNDDDSSITRVSEVKDLGVLVTCSFTPSAQCKAAYNTARRVLFLIRRSLVELSPRAFVCLFCSLVRPHLEYLSPAYIPYLEGDIKHMERLQRMATRLVTGLNGLTYEQRLQKLSLPPLKVRRQQADLLTAYKMFTGKLDIPFGLFFDQPSRPGLRGHIFKVAPHVSSPNGVSAASPLELHLCEIAFQPILLLRTPLRYSRESLRTIGSPFSPQPTELHSLFILTLIKTI